MGDRARLSALWVAVLAIGASCIPPTESDEPRAPPPSARTTAPAEDAGPAVVLVMLDGARWQEIFLGSDPERHRGEPRSAASITPHLHALLAERGAAVGAPGHGPAMSASGPNYVSLPGYSEVFTGRRRPGCADNDCPPTSATTLFDDLAASGQGSAAFFSSWERLDRAASRDPGSLVLSAGRSRVWRPEELRDDPGCAAWLARGASADPRPGSGDFRPDRLTAGLALRYLEARRPRLLFLGLGEPDELAHDGDYEGYLASLGAADAVVGRLVDALDRMGERGAATTLLVTADHGRARTFRDHGEAYPESGRVWLVAAGQGIRARGFVDALRPHRLADVAPTARMLLGLPADGALGAGAPLDELWSPSPLESAMAR